MLVVTQKYLKNPEFSIDRVNCHCYTPYKQVMQNQTGPNVQ